jgi:hypothetical protein
MRSIGLDLAVQAAHKAVVLDDAGHFCTPILTLHTRPIAKSRTIEPGLGGSESHNA